MQSIRPRSGSNPRLLCLTNIYFGQHCLQFKTGVTRIVRKWLVLQERLHPLVEAKDVVDVADPRFAFVKGALYRGCKAGCLTVGEGNGCLFMRVSASEIWCLAPIAGDIGRADCFVAVLGSLYQ